MYRQLYTVVVRGIFIVRLLRLFVLAEEAFDFARDARPSVVVDMVDAAGDSRDSRIDRGIRRKKLAAE